MEAGQTQLTLKDGSKNFSDGKGGASFKCAHVKCGEVKTGQYLLVVSTASLDGAQLVATTDGQTEKAPLAGGTTQADHSLMLYQGGKTKVDVSTPWSTKEFEAVSLSEMPGAGSYVKPVTIAYDARLSAAYRTPFEATLGWAATDQAWLVVSVENYQFRSSDALRKPEMNWAGSWSATAGGSAVETVDTGYTDRVVFKIPKDATDFQITYQPKGTYKYSYVAEGPKVVHKEKDVAAPDAATVDIKFS